MLCIDEKGPHYPVLVSCQLNLYSAINIFKNSFNHATPAPARARQLFRS